MRRSKIEIHIDILRELSHKGPLKLTHIMHTANVNCSELKEYLDFLLKQGLIEKRIIGKSKVVFAVNQRGINVLKYFGEFKQILPVDEQPRNQSITLRSQLTNNSLPKETDYLRN